MTYSAVPELYRLTTELPPHLKSWELPPGWSWGSEGLAGQHRHYQEVIDALGRSLSLVSVPDDTHALWLENEARHLAHRNHPTVPTTYHYWAPIKEAKRGPGYLRRWIVGETMGARLKRTGLQEVPSVLRVLRELGSALAYLHDAGSVHGAVATESVWIAPMGRIWILGWQWAIPLNEIPETIVPDFRYMPMPNEWVAGVWAPTPLSDQWQLAAVCFALLTGEYPPSQGAPPLNLIRPDCPNSVANVLARALDADSSRRYPTVGAMVRAIDRVIGTRSTLVSGEQFALQKESDEVRLRWATADDYEVLAALGSGSFGSVWRVRDLSLGREVALKLLHPHVARDERAIARFRREAQLAAQLNHPAIVPIYDWDSRGEVTWYTMELAEGGSVAEMIARSGPRPLAEIAPQVDLVLSGLAAAHAVGIVHRDLKPENVLIDRYRRWRVADFGIANITGEETAGASGTPAFAAPEQLLGEAQDAPADCFSIAAIVTFVLSGTAPFGEQDSKAILARELKGEVDLSSYPPEIGEWLRRGLSADPDERFADAAEMRAAWRDAVEAVYDRERRVPWWRRLLGSEEAGPSWSGEAPLATE